MVGFWHGEPMRLVTANQKTTLLTILASETCPNCQRPKIRFHWLCWHCNVPHMNTVEHRALGDTCDQHMLAAQAYLDLAGTR